MSEYDPNNPQQPSDGGMAPPTMDAPHVETQAQGDPGKDWAAITALVCGCVSLITCFCCGIFGLPVQILGVIFGIIGLKSTKRPLALTGLILSIVFIILGLLVSILGIGAQLMSEDGFGGQF